jgi:cyclopropane-fatty-acyl-phospholipid synthase
MVTAVRSRSLGDRRTASASATVEDVLASAEIQIDGPDPWDIQVLDDRFYDRVLADGSLGLGESYMDGWWESAAIDQMVERALVNGLKEKTTRWQARLARLRLRLFNLQSLRDSRRVAQTHYDLGNDFFARMLGPTMTYSCGYWPGASTLDEAQDAKHDLICRKLGLEQRHRLLDIGCGWGQLLGHAYRRTGCSGRGVTISEPQWCYATRACEGLPIDIACIDYRDPAVGDAGVFDRIASVGMFEHVGTRNYREFFARVSSLLADDGLFILHTIGCARGSGVDAWIDRYIFPNSVVPSIRDLARHLDELFVMEDWHCLRHDYDRTLMAWAHNFETYARSPEFPFDRRFVRMWRYYLYSFAGGFRAGNNMQLWQIVLSKNGTKGGYRSIR